MRVIAGTLGGRRLRTPRGLVTRPTSDRVRESLFMALEPLDDGPVVDLFAGSGALGIEALSRGASHADFVERDRRALDTLRTNLAELGLEARATVWPLDLPRGLSRLAAALKGARIVFADPPYGGGPARDALAALGQDGVLSPSARVVIEHHHRDALPEEVGTLRRTRERRHGETVVSTYQAALAALTEE